MSAKFVKVYCKCGEPIQGKPVFCKHCGIRVADLPDDVEDDGLTTITSAVREFTDTASDEKRNAKYNQQQWNLFETNYQRDKGITTEESLQEIEAFSRDGVLPEPAPRKNEALVGGKFRYSLDRTIREHEEKERKKKEEKEAKKGGGGFMQNLGKRLSLSRRNSSSKHEGQKGFQGVDFAPKTDAGAAFFAEYQKKEERKYKPQYM